MKKQKSKEKEICEKCKITMKVISRTRRLLDREEMGDMTDAVESEYEAAQEGGDSSDFEITQITYECPKCHNIKIVEEM
jgi:ssDNA-binding Zn-finger/Zn-ribbon topoisomerase 1